MPTLAVRCPCGTNSSVKAGDAVTCACGRRFDTGLLPGPDLRGLNRLVVKSRRNRVAFVATMLFVVAALMLVGRSAPLPLTLAVFVVAWLRFCRPWRRRRHQSAHVGELPSWQLPASADVSE